MNPKESLFCFGTDPNCSRIPTARDAELLLDQGEAMEMRRASYSTSPRCHQHSYCHDISRKAYGAP